MNPFANHVINRVHCMICGGPGNCDIRFGGQTWTKQFVHSDPRVCQENLARKEQEETEEQNVEAGAGI